ncbi:MAG: tRNA uridine-5-carboxymethylaminomethyl(34) synthesis GTPase MnmE [Acidobacteriaceae bacterium]|nr:tRNA uridine-5-carboxymethylaminomethyl(34) synthesis GTPase MnmE [Acidobacteriaceae bacterium]
MNGIEQETIVAISTAVGRGGIGVVRLSGERAREISAPLLRLRHELAAGRARFGEVIDAASGETLDEAVATFFAAPNSYTGEDVVEIAAHGSPVLLEYIVRQCCAQGARLAEPGEFTQRAFLAGRLDLTQAEAVNDLIGSSTLEQARVAARQLGGSLAKTVAPVKAELVGLIAAMEAGIDFAEDDIDVMASAQIAAQIATIRQPLAELERSFAYGRIVREGFRLAIVGRPNAGKSSLFNRLVERERAIVTAAPGTTRDTVAERVAIEGIPVELIDTAGLRDHAGVDEAERLGIARSREAMAEADVVLLVVDATTGLREEDRAVLESAAGENGSAVGSSLLLAWNKSDLAAAGVSAGGDSPVADAGFAVLVPDAAEKTPREISTSALTGEGISALRAAIVSAVAGADGGLREAGMLTNLRQHQAVEQALRGLDAAQAAVAARTPHEMLLLDLYESLRGLDALTGATTSEDVLSQIFSRFCIGK